jgi:hypothetical protein
VEIPLEKKESSAEDPEVERTPLKTIFTCAIDEKELNKVELAYFKRPQNLIVLSDK